MGDVLVMRIQLTDAHASAPPWPDGAQLRPFDPRRHASPARALLNAAYARGGGEVRDVEAWWGEISIDPEFDAALCFAVFEAHTDALIAFAHAGRRAS